MQIPVDEIQIKEGRRELNDDHVRELADSIRELGLLNPITIDKDHTLIAGLHRLEAVKLLEWLSVECTVSSLEGLKAELAEIDENFVRNDLSALEYGEILLRRKEIYEMLHPETKAGVAQAVGMNKTIGNNVAAKSAATSKSFVQDTAEKLGIAQRTIRQQIQTAKNLSPETKEIIKDTDTKITQKTALKLSRLEPEQQKEAASLLAAKEIKSVDDYKAAKAPVSPPAPKPEPIPEPPVPPVPSTLPNKPFFTFKDAVAELKTNDKPWECTPDCFVSEFSAFSKKFIKDINWYHTSAYEEAFSLLSEDQLERLQQIMDSMHTAIEMVSNQIERMQKNELQEKSLSPKS